MKTLSHRELINEFYTNPAYVHLSKSPAVTFVPQPQTFAFGNNTGGRPEGMWISHGVDWLRFTAQTADPTYNSYRYLYQIEFDLARICVVNRENFAQFDQLVPSYWLNFDYFNIDIKDKISKTRYIHSGELKFNFASLRKKSHETMYDILIANNIIFDNITSARKCTFYSKMGNALIERFKFKNWSYVSKTHAGVYFPDYTDNHPANNYFWYQSIDIPSGCIWDPAGVKINLKYIFSDDKWQLTV
jgi:hypothetical protein